MTYELDRRRFLMLSAAGAVVLAGCGKTSKKAAGPTTTGAAQVGAATQAPLPRPTIRLAGGDQGFPSPFAYMRGPGYVQMSYLYDTLLWKDSTGAELPWLASSFTRAPDGLTYTFELRDNLRWHDGQPLTPDDVVFTFGYFAAQKLSPQVIVQPVPDIAGVEATGPHTVVFHLKNPVATFVQFGGAGAVPIVPRHIWSGIDNAAAAVDPKLLVGSGPYRLESYNRGDGSYAYAANDDYFLGKPFVRRIENRPVAAQPGAELTALAAGDLDAASASGVQPDALAQFRADKATYSILEETPGTSQLALYWNLAKGGALADVRFRQACARAIDRQDLVKRLFGGQGTPGNPGWIPPQNPFNVPVEQYGFDVARANRDLDAAGYRRPSPTDTRNGPEGNPLRFGLSVANPPPPAVEVLVAALKAIGVELVPQGLDTAAFNAKVIAGDVEVSLIGSGGMNSDLAPDYLRQVYSSKTKLTQHAQGYANAEVDDLAQRQLAATDDAERKKAVARIQELIAADLPLLPLYYPTSFNVVRTATFDQWYTTPGGVAGVIPTIANKAVFVTGLKTGTKVRPIKE